ncbi:hypothetical protein [Streptomyces carpinensis]|uniref:Secreted protein n=1 Tax=Streptomyces carpinensis TaxID=66369 RepID=A0ABV1W7Q3_9ACTN|nr:hypothetical protein [Streptomyces carpinensis]
MQVRGRRIRFTAVLAIVVLALTGFSRGHGHGHSRHSGGGGGCSSSQQDHDSSSSSSTSGGGSYDDSTDDSSRTGGGYYTRRPTHRATATPSGGSRGTALEGVATLISCATGTRPYATVEVTNPNGRKAGFQVRVTFYDDEGSLLTDESSLAASVPAHGKATTRVPLAKNFLSSVDHCQVDGQAEIRS